MREKLLYVTHVDWDWIKQRPQFLAEQLSKHFNVTVLYLYSLRRSRMTKNSRTGLKMRRALNLPFQYQYPWLYRLNRLFLQIYFSLIVRLLKPKYVWITHPVLYDYIPRKLPGKLIYDCMDDVQAFNAGSAYYANRLLELEKELVGRADLVFVSSEKLRQVLDDRCSADKSAVLLRNAFGGNLVEPDVTVKSAEDIYTITYVGTVASWLDLDDLYRCVESIDNIEFEIVGPVTIDVSHWNHERIRFTGPIEHSRLYEYVRESHCLIMPFRLNDLVLSVDPVKLYDYINYNKPVISIYYDEIKRFEAFVDFYGSSTKLPDVIRRMISSGFRNKYSPEERIRFLSLNSWEARMSEALEHLSN